MSNTVNTPKLHRLAQACWQSACNPHGIIREEALAKRKPTWADEEE
jgi:hypothetical protein